MKLLSVHICHNGNITHAIGNSMKSKSVHKWFCRYMATSDGNCMLMVKARGWQHNTCCNKVYGNKMHGGSKWRQGRRKDGHSSQVKLPVPSSAPQLSSKMVLGGWGWYNLSHILTTLPNSETNQVKLPVPSASQLSFKTSVSLLFHWGPPPSVNAL